MGRRAKQTTTESRPASRSGGPDGEARFVEDLGIFFEDLGYPRMAGRIFAALLLADPPDMSSADLAAFLSASSGSVSTMTRELIRLGMAERVGVPGQRRDYFRAAPSALPQVLRDRLGIVRRMHALMERGEELVHNPPPSVRRRLEELHESYEYLEGALQAALDQWEEHRRARR
jgi:DNA-binding transcriptional regulator GbsR (MarR family)